MKGYQKSSRIFHGEPCNVAWWRIKTKLILRVPTRKDLGRRKFDLFHYL